MGERIVLKARRTPAPPWRERFAPNRLHALTLDEFTTEGGAALVNLRVAYRVFGNPSPTRDNVVLVYHALTGDANCAGYSGADGPVAGWWESLFAAGEVLDSARWCVICPNHVSSCYGSSGPLDTTIDEDEPLGLRFPTLTPRDLVRIYEKLLEYLELPRLALVLGGSLGGMLALETAIMLPTLAERVAVFAAPAESSAQALAFNHIQRRCFDLDLNFRKGRYHAGPKPLLALSLARQIAMITYRSPGELGARFGREVARSAADTAARFEVERYLEHQGEKLIRRFDPNSYLKLLDMLDAHDIGRDRGGVDEALRPVRARLLLVGIDTDILYTPEEVRFLHGACQRAGLDATYRELATIHGHDGFLIEQQQVSMHLREFIGD